jgi:hypothetical protein
MSKKLRLTDLFLLLSISCSYLTSLLLESFAFDAFAATLTFLIIAYHVEVKSSVHMMFGLGFVTFIYVPAILNGFYLDTSFAFFYVTSLVSFVFIMLTRGIQYRHVSESDVLFRYLFWVFCLYIVLSLIALGSAYVTPIFAFYVMIFSLALKPRRLIYNSMLGLAFFLVFSFYALFYWSGFGRVVVFGWLFVAFLYFCYVSEIRISKWVFLTAPSLASVLISSRSLLDLRFSGFESALHDSAFGPYRLASGFYQQFVVRGFDLSGFFDQILFTLFVYVPRAIWDSKPYGFGFEYTTRHLPQYLIDSGHSIASTLVGDHIYFLGWLGVPTSFVMVILIAKACRFLYAIQSLNGRGVIILSSSMMVFVWGGMTSLSARVALPLIMFFILTSILLPFINRKRSNRFGPGSCGIESL